MWEKNRFTFVVIDVEIENVVKDWFRFVKDRYGGRRERERKKMVEIERVINENRNSESS